MGVKISKDEEEILNASDIIVQLGMLSDDKISKIKENQTIIGVLNPYKNKEQLENLAKKNKSFFSRTTSKNYKSSINGYIIFTSKSCWL